MKYIKLFILGLLPWILGACNKEEEVALNTGDATVEFESASVTVKESVTSVNLPIVVKGEHTGKIVVYATMTEKSEGIEIDKNVIITTETLNFLEGTETLNLEVGLVGISNDEVNEGRSVTFEIKEVNGAKVGTNNTCTVNFTENNPMEGTYVVGGVDALDAGTLTCELIMEEGRDDVAYLDFGTGTLLTVYLSDIEEPYKKCKFTIMDNSSIGSGYSILHVNSDFQTQNKNFTGTFENNTFIFNVSQDCGLGIVDSQYIYYLYLATADTPLTIYKK